ncbi:MAG: hypothetical protein ACOWYE_11955 [Desulfatiglandales bacterium]
MPGFPGSESGAGRKAYFPLPLLTLGLGEGKRGARKVGLALEGMEGRCRPERRSARGIMVSIRREKTVGPYQDLPIYLIKGPAAEEDEKGFGTESTERGH